MSERLEKQTERVDQVERHVSSVEDEQTALATGQLKVNTELDILKHKIDYLESRSPRNNLRIVGLAESTSIVQDARKQFLLGKKQLRALQLDYRMLYPAKLRLDVEGNTIFFTDHKKLEQFVNRKLADKRNAPGAEPANV
ncbi:hypothetical protein NDU88_004529 [Pleurodeles waltl]|uniref:Uncharacterized protein n=1 Tax=Pleurodeles waltl TaxID=8319 RepID=A0AAV7QI39_PLEWA|nr:hypothetical protein NDU88_004529 [Pleurodeles waltl]